MGLFGSYGMGVVLSMKDKMSPGLRSANTNLGKFKKNAKGTADAVVKQADRMAASMERYNKRFRGGLKIAAGGLALAVPLGLAAKSAATFEDSMNDVLSLLVGTGVPLKEARGEVDDLGQEILRFAKHTRQPLNEVAAAAYEITSALGIDVAKGAFRRAADMATAGKGTIQEATKVMTSVLATFGERWGDGMSEIEKSDKVFNIVSGTIAAFNTDLTKLAAGLTYAVGPANLLGMSLAETTATIGMLQTKGLESSMAGTAFAAGLRSLTQMTMKFGNATEKAKVEAMGMSEYLAHWESKGATGGKASRRVQAAGGLKGLEISDESGRMLPLWQIVKNIEEIFGITKEKAAEAAELITEGGLEGAAAFQALGLSLEDATMLQAAFGDEGGRMFSLLLGQSDALREHAESIDRSTRGLDMLNARQMGAVAKFEMTTNHMKAQAIVIGSELLPAINDVIDGVDGMLSSWSDYLSVNPDAAKWIAWGGVMTSTLLTVGGAIFSMIAAVQILRVQMALGATLGVTTGGLLGFGLAAKVSAGFTWLFSAALSGYVGAAKMAAIATWGLSKSIWATTVALLANPITWIVIGVAALIAGLYMLVKHWDWVKDAAKKTIGWMGTQLGKLKGVLVSVWEWIKRVWESMTNAIMASPGFKALKALIDMAKDVIAWLENTDDTTVTMRQKPIPATLPAGSLAPTIPQAQSKLLGQGLAQASGYETEPALPAGMKEPTAATIHNHFNIKTTGPIDERKLSIEIEKRRQESIMRGFEGVR